MLVKDIMSRNPITAASNTKFEKLWELIFEKRISGLPIVNKKKQLLGIVSEEDIISKFYPSYEQYFFDPSSFRDLEQTEKNISRVMKLKAKDLMNKNVYTTEEESPIMKAASSMLIYKVSCLPVIKKKKGKKVVIGIICKGDIFSQLFKANIKKIKTN
jgi:CBS-domain-containing membrane protein